MGTNAEILVTFDYRYRQRLLSTSHLAGGSDIQVLEISILL